MSGAVTYGERVAEAAEALRIRREARRIVDAEDAPPRIPGRLVSLLELTDADTSDPLIDGLLLPDSLAVLWGQTNTGKSAIAFDQAIAQGTGGQWCGRQCRAVPVAILAYEGRYGLRRRLDAACEARGVQDLASLPVYVYDHPPLLADTDGIDRLARDLAQQGIGVVYIDTLAAACAGTLDIDSGTGGDASRAVAALRTIMPAGGAVWATHHCGHDGSRMRGAYALLAAIDTEIHVGDGVISTRKQRDLPSDLRVSYSLLPHAGTVIVGYGGTVEPPRDDLRERIAAYLAAHPDASATAIWQAVRGNRNRVFGIVRDLRLQTGTSGTAPVPVPLVPRSHGVPVPPVPTPKGGTDTGTGTARRVAS